MKITGVETLILSAPTRGLDWFGGSLETWDSTLAHIKTDAGIDGTGEVSQCASAAGVVPGIVECLEPLLSRLDPRNPIHIGNYLYERSMCWAHGGISAGVIDALEKVHGIYTD